MEGRAVEGGVVAKINLFRLRCTKDLIKSENKSSCQI